MLCEIYPLKSFPFNDVDSCRCNSYPFSYHDKKVCSKSKRQDKNCAFNYVFICAYRVGIHGNVICVFSLAASVSRTISTSKIHVSCVYSLYASETSEAMVKFRQRYFSYLILQWSFVETLHLHKRLQYWPMIRETCQKMMYVFNIYIYICWYVLNRDGYSLGEVMIRDSRQVGKKRENARLTYHRTNCPRDFATPPDNL